ncbi:MAG: glycosyltransferase [Candidatus Micrarchaeaceae archaeon]
MSTKHSKKDDMVRVGLIGIRGQFAVQDLSQKYSRSVDKTSHDLYTNLKKLRAADLNISTIEVPSLPLGPGISLMLQTMLKNLSGYDILHNLELRPFFPLRKGHAVTLSTLHGLEFIFDPTRDADRSLRGALRHSLLLPLSLESVRRSDYMIAVSSLVKSDAVKWGYNKDRIFIVNDSISSKYIASPIVTRGKKRNKFVVGYLGTFRARKNVESAIRAFMRLNGSDYSFEIWGKRTFEYERLTRIASPDKRIVFMGPAPEEKIVQVYDGFDVFVFPTLYEGFGIPIIEAQSRGLPVIIFKRAKVAEEVRRYCIEAEDEEHMAQIIENLRENGYNEKQRKKAIEYARGFTPERQAKETLAVYRKIVQ